MRKQGIIRGLLVFLLLLLAIGLIVYPFIANYVFENRSDSIVELAQESMEAIEDTEKEEELEAAREYNQVIASGRVELTDPFKADVFDENVDEYNSLLCVNDDGVMGFVEIPSIDLMIPIYHGTSHEVLEKGAGHLQGTSLPIGGESIHTVITGHTGLSNARMFTDLTELEENDIFFLKVMGEKLAYKVDQIAVVDPSDVSKLQIVSGEDYCTLLTCTPYGVNSHRLLVRGVRTDYQEAIENEETFEVKPIESKWMSEYKNALYMSMACFTVGLVLLFVYRMIRNYYDDVVSGGKIDDFA